jgi:ABC-type antimicrobial peptide transport system permease subunit
VVVRPTLEQLERFYALENAYLSIFMMLGGLALALGSVGVGVVVLRQVSERRGELALLRAVGFSRGRLTWGLMVEHAGLGGLGLLVGVAATALAVWPPLRSGLAVPWLELTIAVAAIGASLFVWVMLAAWAALRGPLLDALREE